MPHSFDPAARQRRVRLVSDCRAYDRKATLEEETIMATNRTKMTKEEFELFQKAAEAMRLFSENPNAMRGFVDALKKGDFSGARVSLNTSLDRRRKEGRAAADPSEGPSDKRNR